MIDRDALIALIGDDVYDSNERFADRILALDEPEHGHPFEVVIPCNSEAEAWEERADLHVAAEARSIIRRVR